MLSNRLSIYMIENLHHLSSVDIYSHSNNFYYDFKLQGLILCAYFSSPVTEVDTAQCMVITKMEVII